MSVKSETLPDCKRCRLRSRIPTPMPRLLRNISASSALGASRRSSGLHCNNRPQSRWERYERPEPTDTYIKKGFVAQAKKLSQEFFTSFSELSSAEEFAESLRQLDEIKECIEEAIQYGEKPK